MTLVEKLRRYVGEQGAPEIHSQAWESERLELLETVQVRVRGTSAGGWPRTREDLPRREGCRPRSPPCSLAALAGGPGRPAHNGGAAAGARAEPHAHPVHAGRGAGQEGRPCGRDPAESSPPAHTHTSALGPVTWAAQRETKMQLPPLLPQERH